MTTTGAITQQEVDELARDWYRKLDVHAPLEEFQPMLGDGVELVFPEATVKGYDGFAGWYDRVINIFFDEVHTVKQATMTPRGNEGDVAVVVRWEASVWKPPAANSERIVLDAYQTWTVQRSPATGRVVVTRYVVDSLDYAEGSAKL
jgi:hypothetical protein